MRASHRLHPERGKSTQKQQNGKKWNNENLIPRLAKAVGNIRSLYSRSAMSAAAQREQRGDNSNAELLAAATGGCGASPIIHGTTALSNVPPITPKVAFLPHQETEARFVHYPAPAQRPS